MKIHIIWLRFFRAIAISFLFVVSLIILAAHGQSFFEWMDSSPRTGIVLLGIGSVAYIACFFYGVVTRK